MSLFLDIRELMKNRMTKQKNMMSLKEKLQRYGTRELSMWYQLLWDYQEVQQRTAISWAPAPVFIVPKTHITKNCKDSVFSKRGDKI